MRSILTSPDTTMADASAAAANRKVQRASKGPRSESSAPVSDSKLSSTAATLDGEELVSRHCAMFKLAQGVAVLLAPKKAGEVAAPQEVAVPCHRDSPALIQEQEGVGRRPPREAG